MGAVLCIIGGTLYQRWQDKFLESHNNNQKWEENILEYERVDKEFKEYINTFYNQTEFDHDAYEEKEEAYYPYINLKKKGGKIYLESLAKIAEWAVSNCVDDQLPKAIEMKERIVRIISSCQEDNFDPTDYPRISGNYRKDINTLLSDYIPGWGYIPGWSTHIFPSDFSSHWYPTDFNAKFQTKFQAKYKTSSGPCMICDNPHKPMVLSLGDCFSCSENICYCRCYLCRKCYCSCQLCGESHPTSVCDQQADYENSGNEKYEVDSESSPSNGGHAEFSIYDILASNGGHAEFSIDDILAN